MKVIIAVALLFAVAQAAPMLQDAEAELMFEGYMSEYSKTYASDAEKAKRLAIFKDNLNTINEHNKLYAAGKSTFSMGVNQFTDLTNEEFAALVSRPFNRTRPSNVKILPTEGLDDSVDWRTKGAVTPVKNQGQCGSCWSFSTTGSTEGAVAIATGSLKSLSEQQLVDCSTAEGNHGCNGGLMDYGFEYIIKNGGLDSESDYPYTARDGTCNSAKAAKHVSTIASYKDVAQNDESQLAAAVAKGPVSVAIEADQMGFQHYSHGVFDGALCGHRLDHGVLVVGYTSDYWIVKNSWGETWGDNGYINMKRGVSKEGICGIAMQPSYPEATSSVAAPPNSHYEDPNGGGCQSDEEDVQITGLQGSFCSPSCSASSPCPSDVPAGTTARPECVLEKQGSSQPTNCALICNPMAKDGGCPQNASCKPISGTGVCTYDS